MKTLEEYLAEDNAAGASLKQAQQPKRPKNAEARALELFMRLVPEDQEKHLRFLEKALGGEDNDAWTDAGVGGDVAAKNRLSLKDNPSKNKNTLDKLKQMKADQLKKQMEEWFTELSAETHQDMIDTFNEAVENKSSKFGHGLQELLAQYGFLFAEEQEIVVNRLLIYIENLQELIEHYEDEAAVIRQEIAENQRNLSEEVIFATASQKPRHRPIVDMFPIEEDNRYLMETDEAQHTNDPKMRQRLEFLNRTTRNVDTHGPNDNLMEAWRLNS
jgi:hypothetical protein